MTFATNITATALRLLTDYGQSISVVRDNIGAYSPQFGTVTDSSDTAYTGYGYPDNYTNFDMNASNADGGIVGAFLIQEGDIKLYFSSTTTPLVNDIFTINSVAYTALNIQNITAQGSNIIYIVQLRK